MNGYHIALVAPGTVEIHEDAATYQLTEAEVRQAIENVKANRRKYTNYLAYQRRLSFFEEVLKVFERKAA